MPIPVSFSLFSIFNHSYWKSARKKLKLNPCVKLLFPFINAHLDFTFNIQQYMYWIRARKILTLLYIHCTLYVHVSMRFHVTRKQTSSTLCLVQSWVVRPLIHCMYIHVSMRVHVTRKQTSSTLCLVQSWVVRPLIHVHCNSRRLMHILVGRLLSLMKPLIFTHLFDGPLKRNALNLQPQITWNMTSF